MTGYNKKKKKRIEEGLGFWRGNWEWESKSLNTLGYRRDTFLLYILDIRTCIALILVRGDFSTTKVVLPNSDPSLSNNRMDACYKILQQVAVLN